MLDRTTLFLLGPFLLTLSMARADIGPCPGDSAAIHFRLLDGSQMAVSVGINGSGPYDFTVDTGSEITIIDPKLAAKLQLEPRSSITIGFLTNLARANLVKADLISVGPAAVPHLAVAVKELTQLQTRYPRVRGILGQNFLSHFDVLIDYRRKVVCLDQFKKLQTELHGERIPVIQQTEQDGDLANTLSVLVAVRVHGSGKKRSILRLDSGSTAAVLFDNSLEFISWQQRKRAHKARVAGHQAGPAFAALTSRSVEIGSHITRQISFLTPITTNAKAVKPQEDGLLPTALFDKVFISCVDHFVIFDPS